MGNFPFGSFDGSVWYSGDGAAESEHVVVPNQEPLDELEPFEMECVCEPAATVDDDFDLL